MLSFIRKISFSSDKLNYPMSGYRHIVEGDGSSYSLGKDKKCYYGRVGKYKFIKHDKYDKDFIYRERDRTEHRGYNIYYYHKAKDTHYYIASVITHMRCRCCSSIDNHVVLYSRKQSEFIYYSNTKDFMNRCWPIIQDDVKQLQERLEEERIAHKKKIEFLKQYRFLK